PAQKRAIAAHRKVRLDRIMARWSGKRVDGRQPFDRRCAGCREERKKYRREEDHSHGSDYTSRARSRGAIERGSRAGAERLPQFGGYPPGFGFRDVRRRRRVEERRARAFREVDAVLHAKDRLVLGPWVPSRERPCAAVDEHGVGLDHARRTRTNCASAKWRA